jgi:hypothetical protein
MVSLTVLLAGCGALPGLQSLIGTTGRTISAAGQSAAQPVDSLIGLGASPAPSDVPTATVDAIKRVIQHGNDEETQAVAAHDPTLMRDTSTAAYYDELAQGFNDMLNSGVTAIQLVNLNWGPVTLQGAASAQATTVETWRTTYADGSTLQESDTNVYTLVLQGGTWLVQDDQHTGAGVQQAQPGAPIAPSPVTPVTPASPTGAARSQSSNWSGYYTTGGTFTTVAGSWTIPNISPGTSGADATWVGIGGMASRDLIQAGTQAVVQSGRVVYTAWWETLPQASQSVPLDISAGDTVSVSITQQSGGAWLITILDVTTGDSFRKSVEYQSSRSSAEWVEEAPAVGRAGRMGLVPLDNFGAVTFTNATTVKDGQTRSLGQAGAQPITMYNRAEQALAQPSVVGEDGASFTVTRTSVPSTSSSAGPTMRVPRQRFGQ